MKHKSKITKKNFITLLLEMTYWVLKPLRSKMPGDPYHESIARFFAIVNRLDRPIVLEVGARVVTGQNYRQKLPNCGNYVGFDVKKGANVDVVGDAHNLSHYFSGNSFDAIFSVSTFEHLMMPWKVVLEMNKVLKVGGVVMVCTHPAWPPHETPWDFFRFSKFSFEGLFNYFTGFEILFCEEGVPGRIMGIIEDRPTYGIHRVEVNLGVCLVAKKTGNPKSGLDWNVDASGLLSGTYPG